MSEVISSVGRAWVREVADTFDQAILGNRGRAPDVALARIQHQDYVRRLTDSGLEVETLPADDRFPDCVFIEDAALILDGIVVATLPGARERRGEVPAVADALGEVFEMGAITAPATLDGGDVIVSRNTVYVGRSGRTNQAGIDQLTDLAAEVGMGVTPVDVHGVLHLKSAVLPVGEETLVVTPGTVDESILSAFRILHEDQGERNRFSALGLSDRTLVTSSAPKTSGLLEGLGFDIDPIDVSEILAADGGLTCMSIIARGSL